MDWLKRVHFLLQINTCSRFFSCVCVECFCLSCVCNVCDVCVYVRVTSPVNFYASACGAFKRVCLSPTVCVCSPKRTSRSVCLCPHTGSPALFRCCKHCFFAFSVHPQTCDACLLYLSAHVCICLDSFINYLLLKLYRLCLLLLYDSLCFALFAWSLY